ncbi:MAG: DAK2 domain-containing protein [Eubacteriales bacterium]|nr:DAK2 domain-containing protein [Eubacteriales bacterium]
MNTRRIDGVRLDALLRSGLALLQQREEQINALNVFPVADGDTGTNMFHTLENGLSVVTPVSHLGQYLKGLSGGMLLGARGNSGVILSQFFKGMSVELSRRELLGPGELRNGLVAAYRAAYQAVLQPVEGTMLTVAREGIENIRRQITRNSCIEDILSMYVAEMKKTLTFTPEMLPVLKEAGVVDSGAVGLIAVFEGMLACLYGQEFTLQESADKPARPAPADDGLFNENSAFDDGYCVEFILQLMKTGKYNPRFTVEKFSEDLRLFGSSIVVAQEGTRVKVHIHTLHPARTLSLAEEYGVFVDFKLENMQIQHNERDRMLQSKSEPLKPLAILTVADGEGMKELFSGLGCDAVADGGKTVNLCTEDFLKEFAKLKAERIVVLPNNGNAVMAAEQAAGMYESAAVTVVRTHDMVEGYFAVAMDVADSEDPERRIQQMTQGVEGLQVLAETTAVRDYVIDGIDGHSGESVVLLNGNIVAGGKDVVENILLGLARAEDVSDKETCVIFTGADADEQETERLVERLQEIYPLLETNVLAGGQKLYRYLIGVL